MGELWDVIAPGRAREYIERIALENKLVASALHAHRMGFLSFEDCLVLAIIHLDHELKTRQILEMEREMEGEGLYEDDC